MSIAVNIGSTVYIRFTVYKIDPIFEISDRWQVIICKQYKYAVWPQEISKYLQSATHRVPITHRTNIQEEIRQRSDIIQSPEEWVVVHEVPEPIDGLVEYPTAIQCITGSEYQYIATRIESIRYH